MTGVDKMADCPVALTGRFVSGKWTPRILWALRTGPLTFGALCRATGASEKAMAGSLRALTQRGVISRTPLERGGVQFVEYAYTDLGLSLVPVLDAMGAWGLRRIEAERADPR
jgi:DNA-binding HxlR family transcriptional regulator